MNLQRMLPSIYLISLPYSVAAVGIARQCTPPCQSPRAPLHHKKLGSPEDLAWWRLACSDTMIPSIEASQHRDPPRITYRHQSSCIKSPLPPSPRPLSSFHHLSFASLPSGIRSPCHGVSGIPRATFPSSPTCARLTPPIYDWESESCCPR
jgi:hypothetical protein